MDNTPPQLPPPSGERYSNWAGGRRKFPGPKRFDRGGGRILLNSHVSRKIILVVAEMSREILGQNGQNSGFLQHSFRFDASRAIRLRTESGSRRRTFWGTGVVFSEERIGGGGRENHFGQIPGEMGEKKISSAHYVYINRKVPAEVKDPACRAFFRCERGELRIHAGGHGRLRGRTDGTLILPS